MQRLYGDVVAPHMIPVEWRECLGGGRSPMQATDEAPEPETSMVGSLDETETINLLAAAIIGREWRVISPGGEALSPVTVAILLMRDMMLGAASNESRKR